jgi:hypothetical protein
MHTLLSWLYSSEQELVGQISVSFRALVTAKTLETQITKQFSYCEFVIPPPE